MPRQGERGGHSVKSKVDRSVESEEFRGRSPESAKRGAVVGGRRGGPGRITEADKGGAVESVKGGGRRAAGDGAEFEPHHFNPKSGKAPPRGEYRPDLEVLVRGGEGGIVTICMYQRSRERGVVFQGFDRGGWSGGGGGASASAILCFRFRFCG